MAELSKSPAAGMGKQSQPYYVSRPAQEQHLPVSNHNKRKGMMQNILSYPAQEKKKNI